jgi:hypothetical protein
MGLSHTAIQTTKPKTSLSLIKLEMLVFARMQRYRAFVWLKIRLKAFHKFMKQKQHEGRRHRAGRDLTGA